MLQFNHKGSSTEHPYKLSNNPVLFYTSISHYNRLHRHKCIQPNYLRIVRHKVRLAASWGIQKDHSYRIRMKLGKAKKRLIKLTKSVDKYLESFRLHKKSLDDWFIFKSLKNEFFIQNYLKG